MEQDFYSGLAVAEAANLVVSEINYHPRPLDADELAAGVTNPEDFEFLELLNISSTPVLLDGVAFTNGIVFDFAQGTVPLLAPGEYTVVAGNPDTFAVRYPTVPADRIAGGFDLATRLSNGGEILTAVGPSGLLREFSYDDVAPWPTAPDGLGRSLTLIAPATNPDHSDPASWRSSRSLDGTPGDSDSLSYPSWKTLYNIVSDAQDDDGDGLTSFAEYAHGTDPGTPDVVSLGLSLGPMVVSGVTNTYILTHFTHDLAADDARFQVEQSADLLMDIWQGGINHMDYAGEVVNPDGTAIRSYRTQLPAEAFTNLYLRLRISPR